MPEFNGTAGSDSLSGTSGDDILNGLAGNDVLAGNAGQDQLNGGDDSDLLNGGAGDDIVDGGNGSDRAGYYHLNDFLGGVTVSLLLQGQYQDTGSRGFDLLTNIENLSGTPFADTLIGDAGDNWLWGSAATIAPGEISATNNDYLDGGDGNDLLTVGIGNHILIGGNGIDTVRFTENGSPETGVTISLGLQGGAQDTGNGSWTLTGIENLSGGTANDSLSGNASANTLAGDLGADVLSGGGGDDLLLGDGRINVDGNGVITTFLDSGNEGGFDVLAGGNGNDTLYGGAGNDSLTGGNNNDFLDGGTGDDFVNGGAGDDTINGGDGYDRAGYFNANPALGGITVSLLLQGQAQNTGAMGTDILFNIENVSGTPFADTLTGDGNDNWLWGSGAIIAPDNISTTNNDTIDGGGGNDFIVAGLGNHLLTGGSGTDTVGFFENTTLSPGFTLSLALQGAAEDTGWGNWTISGFENVSGNGGNDTLTGDGNSNILGGGLGDDLLSGGAGNDSLYGDGDFAIDSQGTGGSGPVGLRTDVGVLFGVPDGNDILDGGLGDDQLYGGGGVDTASYASASGSVEAYLYEAGSGEAFGAAGYDVLDGIENLTGSAFGDILWGDEQNNVLDGGGGQDELRGWDGNDTILAGAGDDFIVGGRGDDVLNGGDGYDRVGYFSQATSGVTVNLSIAGPQDTGLGFDTLIDIENVSGTIYGDTLTGNDGDNWLWGSTAGVGSTTNNDTLSGGGGNDLLTVGYGNHLLDGGTGTDTLRYTENGGAENGITVSLALQGAAQATGAGSWTLNGFENLSGGVANDFLTGDGNANLLAGDSGNDTLVGGGGNDTLYGDGRVATLTGASGPITTHTDVSALGSASGNDLLEGGLGNDTLDGGGGVDTATYAHASGNVTANLNSGSSSGADGNDTLSNIENLTGSEFNDNLTGNTGANVIDGLGGNDTLQGHAGDDTIYGGDGNDSINGDLAELNTTVSGNDTIFAGNGNDTIRGGLGNDAMYGGANNDLMRGGGGVDTFDGGSDDGEGFNGIGDRVSFFEQLATQGVVADLRTGVISNDGFGNAETMIGIESLGGDTAYVDTFYGNDGRNYLSVSRGDFVYGFGGDDALQIAAAAAVVDGGSGTDRLILLSSGGWMTPDANGDGLAEMMGAAGAGWTVNLATGTTLDGYGNSGTVTGIENIDGSHLGDTLIGDGNANVFNGSFGDDIFEGSGGNDTLDGGDGIDTTTYAHASGSVTVSLNAGTSSGADGIDTLANIENVTGSEFNDNLTGNTGANVIEGLGGNDTLQGHAGDDTIYGGDGNDSINGDLGEQNTTVSGNDTIYGGNGNDTLRGGLGNDQLYGGTGNDLLRGNAGVDYYDGGADDGEGVNGIGDRVSFYDLLATQGVVADLRTGVISNDGYGNVETMVGIESLGADTAFVDTLYGNDSRNYLAGGRGDFVYGFGGDDLFFLSSAAAVIDGGTGTDRLSVSHIGGSLSPDSNGDGLAESAPDATAGWTVNLATGALIDGYGNAGTVTGIENVDGSIFGDTLVGAAGVNILNGFDGNDILDGGLGNDTLDGGNGLDTASYAGASGAVNVDLGLQTTTGANGNDTLVSIENATGSAFDDTLTGDGLANVLSGLAGNDVIRGFGGNDTINGGDGGDTLIGGAGDDTIAGGAGNDRVGYYHTNAAAGGVTVSLLTAGAQAVGGGQGSDTLSGIESVSGTPFADTLTGDGGDNWLWGSAATISPGNVSAANNDRLDGGGGNDLLTVGIGNHTLIGGTGTDTVRFTENGGAVETALTVTLMTVGRVQTTGNGSWNLTGIENLSGGTAGDKLTGDDFNNVIAGDLGNDILNGNDGVDVLIGDGSINVDENGVITTYYDAASGGGSDSLNGGKGNDFLYGGGGNDTMVGGQGVDRFVIQANSGSDRLTDFALGVDKIVFDIPGGPDDFGDLVITKSGANVLISWGTTDSILIEGYRPSQITASNFEFGHPVMAALGAQTLEVQSFASPLPTVDPMMLTDHGQYYDSAHAMRPMDLLGF